jgi:hypothetical protein
MTTFTRNYNGYETNTYSEDVEAFYRNHPEFLSKTTRNELDKTIRQTESGVASYKSTARHSFKGMVHPKG